MVNKDDTKKCRGTSRYQNIASQGYLSYINEERLKMLKKEDEESKIIRRRMDRKAENAETTNISGKEVQAKRVRFIQKVITMLKDEQDDLLGVYESILQIY